MISYLADLFHQSILQAGDISPWVALAIAIGVAGVTLIVLNTKLKKSVEASTS